MWGLMLVAFAVTTFILWRRIDDLQVRLANAESLSRFQPDWMPTPAAPRPVDWPTRSDSEAEAWAAPIAEPNPAYADSFILEPVVQIADKAPDAPASTRPGFEDIFGRHLPIWAGGITLAVAGFLIVKFSIDAGLLSPIVRVIAGLLFGSGLIAGAEVALRRDNWIRDARVRQALSGAGIATIYASILVAANLYHLVDPLTAFVGLAGVTVLAGLLSLRFGAPSAVLGLVGGLAAPALVGSMAPNILLLSTYLAMTIGGLCLLGRVQRWWWLGMLAVLGGFGWSTLLIAAGLYDTPSALSVGTLILVLSIVLPLLIPGNQSSIFRVVAVVTGCAQMAAIVALGSFVPLNWALYGVFAAALVWLSRREALLADAPLGGLGIGALLALAWPHPDASFAWVLPVGAAICGLPALWRLWREDARLTDAIQLAVIAAAIALIPVAHFAWTTPRADFAPLALLGMGLAGAAAALGWRNSARTEDARFAILSVGAILLGLLATGLVLPLWALAPAIAGAAIWILALGVAAGDWRIDTAALCIAVASFFCLVGYDPHEMMRAYGELGPAAVGPEFARWALVALAMLGFAWRGHELSVRLAAGAVATALLYTALAQIAPTSWVALIPAAMLLALAAAGERAPIPALGVAGAIAGCWAIQPLAIWAVAGAGSLVGMPFYVTAVPPLDMVAIRILAPAVALAVLLWCRPMPTVARQVAGALLALLATTLAHAAWKHAFAVADWPRFVSVGLVERTLWEALLLGASVLAWKLDARRIATGLGITAFLHFGWYTLLMHNPLWSEQAAGPWLIPAYAIGFVAVWLSSGPLPGARAERARDGLRMALILLLAASLLRQIFHGAMLAEGGVVEAEDIGSSLLTIALAIGFLQWGIRRASRDWRIASLVLMLGAVGKVFVFDAAGLDGLMRIGSFAALGVSLIGVGWLYSRYLPDAKRAALTDESYPSDTSHVGLQG